MQLEINHSRISINHKKGDPLMDNVIKLRHWYSRTIRAAYTEMCTLFFFYKNFKKHLTDIYKFAAKPLK